MNPLWLDIDMSTPGALADTASLTDPWELLTSLEAIPGGCWRGEQWKAWHVPPGGPEGHTQLWSTFSPRTGCPPDPASNQAP